MFDPKNISSKSSIMVIAISMLMIFSTGVFFGIMYFVMEAAEDGFKENDCDINNNLYFESCQEMWELSVYPFLSLRYIIVYASYFFIFGNVFAMLVIGYRSGQSPAMAGMLMLIISLFTYASILLSNVYRTMTEVVMFREMMLPFTVYNRVMFYFPWFMFVVSLSSIMLAIVNWQRTEVNSVDDQNY